ncbi:sugar transferase [Dokdonia sp. MED134]|uniref:sugar transferase n=1 Tax=Dokdonia sp. MED134 TaxID=313590 RepID=UPI000068AC1F|nr:sugar transferase [Dokdonia sp. MED134]EAQ40274.1 sugar transferase [Dokdonia sp. MED134]
MYRLVIKPVADVLTASIVFILFLPVFLIVCILLIVVNSGNPFFTQMRPGKNGKIFKIFKFKTMNDKKNENGELLSDKERITKIGQIVRKTSLDELPQLFNVIKGDMSFVGPRPLLVEYLKLYNSHQTKRLKVKPGITGWAQVNGRNAISWEKKFDYDVWYVSNQNMLLDIKILFMTVMKVFKSEGITAEGEVTTKKFEG